MERGRAFYLAKINMPLISNQRLRLRSIPSAKADVGALERFALTFNGFEHCGSFDSCAEVANARKHDTLSDLSTCLCFEQRRWHHFGESPDDAALANWRELIEKIRLKVQAEERT